MMIKYKYLPTAIVGTAAFLAGTLTGFAAEAAYSAEVIAQAEFDECVFDAYSAEETANGLNENTYKKSGLTEQEVTDCYETGGFAKRNQAYAWGMKKKGNKLWWGTGPNVNYLVGGAYFGNAGSTLNDEATAIGENATSKFAVNGVVDEENNIDYGYKVSGAFGDFRPPNIYCYNLDTDALTRLDLDLAPEDAELLWKTLGLRSVGYTAPLLGYPEGIVFVAGPSVTYNSSTTTESLPEVLGVNIFAFDAATGECIGSKSFPQYSNIRKWMEHDGQLYTTVANQDGTGAVLKHNPNPLSPGFPFNFMKVGDLASGGAEIEFFEGRLFVNTWPGVEGNFDLSLDLQGLQTIINLINGPASLYRSPIVPPGGLRRFHAGQWTRVWSSVDYDPDFAISLHYGGGAMEVYDDGEESYLYWGTMHVLNTPQIANAVVYGTAVEPNEEDFETEEEYLGALKAYELLVAKDLVYPLRWISLWRGRDFTEDSGDIDLLYGREMMPSRMDRGRFRKNGDPRANLDLLRYGLFLISNLSQIGKIEDGETVPLFSIPLPFGLSFDITTTFEDGGDWDMVYNGGGTDGPRFPPLYGNEGVANTTIPPQFLAAAADTLGVDLGFVPDAALGPILVSGNTYTWSMQALNGKLYFGTLDSFGGALSALLPGSADGADIFCFPDHNSPAELISPDAFGNPYAYGIRNMQADEERGELYAGTANPQNLRNEGSLEKLANQPNNTDADEGNNDIEPDLDDGGWKVMRVTFTDAEADVESASAKTAGSAINDSVDASDAWLIENKDTSSATVAFTSVAADKTGPASIQWASFPGNFYTVYTASEAEGEWEAVGTYNGTGGTLSFEWDVSTSDIRYVKVVESSDAPIAAL